MQDVSMDTPTAPLQSRKLNRPETRLVPKKLRRDSSPSGSAATPSPDCANQGDEGDRKPCTPLPFDADTPPSSTEVTDAVSFVVEDAAPERVDPPAISQEQIVPACEVAKEEDVTEKL